MARQVGDLRRRRFRDNERIAVRATLAYRRTLEDLARMLSACRHREELKIEAIAERTAVPTLRLEGFEKGIVPVSWSEILLMAPAYGMRVSFITRRLTSVFARVAGQDRHSIEAYLQCRCTTMTELTTADRERINEKLTAPLNTQFVDVTIADWPSCLPPGLCTLLRVERDMIVDQMRGLNACIARVNVDGAGTFAALCGIHQRLTIIATSLEWQLKRHCALDGDESKFALHRKPTADERTMRSVGQALRQCRATVLNAASELEPFAGSGAGCRNGHSSPTVGQMASPASVHLIRSPALEYALFHSVLRLGSVATRLVELEETFP